MPSTRPAPPPPPAPHGPYACRSCTGTMTFFFWLLCLVCLVSGLVIVTLTAKLSYFSRHFPTVAEHNYRTLRADLRQMERRLLQAVEQSRGGAPEAAAPELE